MQPKLRLAIQRVSEQYSGATVVWGLLDSTRPGQSGGPLKAGPIRGRLRATGRYSGPEVGLGAITTPSGVFQPEFVVHCLAESLLAAEITFGGLNRCVSKQELNLLKFSTR